MGVCPITVLRLGTKKLKKLLTVLWFPIALGIITYSYYYSLYEHFQANMDSETEGEIIRSRSSRSGLHIRFVYKVSGVYYYSDLENYHYGSVGELLHKYRKGRKVTVYYDSSNPKFVTVDKRGPTLLFYAKCVGIVILGLFGTRFFYRDSDD